MTTAMPVLTLSLGLGISAQDKHWLSYGPAVVELGGRLTVESKYGPPNYGENPKTDAKVKVYVLVLSSPVNVRGNPKDLPNAESVVGVRRVQLNLFDLKTPYKQFIGRRVLVKGTLFHEITAHDYTEVVMDVRTISAGAPTVSKLD